MIGSILSSGRRLVILLSAPGLMALSGCGGGDDGLSRYAVSGTVTYKGERLDHGNITFTPDDVAKGRVASSTIEGGSYTLGTLGDRDGAVPGQYKVSVTSKEVDPSKIRDRPGRSAGKPKVVGKANQDEKSLIPKKYETSQTSPLTAEVKPQSNSIPFELVD